MEDRNCELLFEYLRSILYDSEVKTLEIDSLDEPFRKLGMGLQYLETAVKEMKQCSAALSKGDLSSFKPCEPESSDLAGQAGSQGRLFSDRFLSGRILGGF